MPLSSFCEVIKTWCTFILGLLAGIIFLAIGGVCWILSQNVKLLAFIFRRRELDGMFQGIERYFLNMDTSSRLSGIPSITIVALLILDGPVELDVLQRQLYDQIVFFKDEHGNLAYEKLQQYPTSWLGYQFYHWEKDFRISTHLRQVQGLTAKNLNNYIASIWNAPFEEKTSMWELLIGPNYDEHGNTGLIFRFHHSIGDGFSMLSMLQSRLMEAQQFSANALIQQSNNSQVSTQTKHSVFSRIYSFICLPRKLLTELRTHHHLPLRDQDTKLDYFVKTTNRMELESLKRARKKLRLPLTCLLTTSISAALAAFFKEDYVQQEGHKLDVLSSVLTFPIPGRMENKLINHFGAGILNIPVDHKLDLVSRLTRLKKELKSMGSSVNTNFRAFMSRFGDLFPLCLYEKIIIPPKSSCPGILITNVPGPSESNSFLNNEIRDMTFWISSPAPLWISFGVFSYNGYIKVGCIGSSDVVKDAKALERICLRIEAEIGKIISDCDAIQIPE